MRTVIAIAIAAAIIAPHAALAADPAPCLFEKKDACSGFVPNTGIGAPWVELTSGGVISADTKALLRK